MGKDLALFLDKIFVIYNMYKYQQNNDDDENSHLQSSFDFANSVYALKCIPHRRHTKIVCAYAGDAVTALTDIVND